MIEVIGNMWNFPANKFLITTNGTIKSNGELVMGRGCALQAKNQYPNLAKDLGELIRAKGNHVHQVPRYYSLITFPVKYNWYEKADLKLIRRSCLEFQQIIDPELVYVMPRPGCGNGKLDWNEVKPLLLDLPDNVNVITLS